MNPIHNGHLPENAYPATSIDPIANEDTQADSTPSERRARGIGATYRQWPQNSTVTIAFQGATEDQMALIKKGFSKVAPYVNLKFKYVPGPDADIRVGPIAVKGQNGASYVGKDALRAPADQPTFFMDFNRSAEKVIATATHEAMHAIGVLHEHQHPERDIKFNEEELIKRFEGASDPQAAMKTSVLDTVKRHKKGPLITDYDSKSIMHYEFTSKELDGAPAIPKNNELSEGDIALLRKMYPPRPLPSLEQSIEQLKATAAKTKLWPDLSTVTVSLLGMNDDQKKFVKHNVEKLQPHINISIKFTDEADGDIRISPTDNGKSWSEIGTDAKNMQPASPTMGIHWDPNRKNTARDIKHMFAKALGFTNVTLPKAST